MEKNTKTAIAGAAALVAVIGFFALAKRQANKEQEELKLYQESPFENTLTPLEVLLNTDVDLSEAKRPRKKDVANMTEEEKRQWLKKQNALYDKTNGKKK